jgi:hypothetical protein
MALNKKKPFEGMDDTSAAPEASGEAGAEVAAAEAPANDTSAKPEAPAATTTALTKPAVTALAKPMAKFAAALTEFEDVLSPEDVQDLGAGAFPKVTADLGGLVIDRNGAKKDLHEHIDLVLISYNERFAVTPGVDNAEAKKTVRYSYDGVTIRDEERSVEEYLKYLKEVAGYDKATVKKYLEVWGQISAIGGVEVPVEDREIVQLQLSPQSVTRWKAFQVQLGLKLAQGNGGHNGVLRVTRLKGERDTNRYGYMDFAVPKAA